MKGRLWFELNELRRAVGCEGPTAFDTFPIPNRLILLAALSCFDLSLST